MDRRFLGTLVIIGIVSTAIGMIIFTRTTATPYTILNYEFPKVGGRGVFPPGEDTSHLTLGLLLNEPTSSVRISYSSLMRVVDRELPTRTEEIQGDTLVEKASLVGLVPHMLNLTDFPIQHDWQPEELEVVSGGTTYDLVLFDFSNITLWAQEPPLGLPIIHGVLFDEDGNVTYYQGGRGFLGWGSRALQSLTVRRNSDEVKYAVESKGSQPTGTQPMTDAPPNGILKEEDLVEDDLITVDIAVDHSLLPEGTHMQIIRIDIGGHPREVLITLLLNQF